MVRKHSRIRLWTRPVVVMVFMLVAGILIVPKAPAAGARKALMNPTPEYPPIARRMSISGTVKVEINIASDGTIKETKVLGGHPILAEAVLQALKKWKYAPANEDTTLELEFRF